MADYRSLFADFAGESLGTLSSAQFDPESGRSMPQVVSSPQSGDSGPHSGTKMVMADWTAALVYTTFTLPCAALYTKRLFIRTWVQLGVSMANPGGASGPHVLRFFQDPPYYDILATNPFTTAWNYDMEMNGGTAGSAFGSFPTKGSWHKFEYFIDMATAGTGVMRIWMDDNLEMNLSGLTYGSTKFDVHYWVSNWGDGTINAHNYIYFDDIEVFTDRNDVGDGTPTTGLMSDATIQASGEAPVIASPSISPRMRFTLP